MIITEFMSLAMAVRLGTPILLFALVVLNVYQSTIIRQLQKELKDLKDGITWGDTCKQRHSDIERRLNKLENRVFNGK